MNSLKKKIYDSESRYKQFSKEDLAKSDFRKSVSLSASQEATVELSSVETVEFGNCLLVQIQFNQTTNWDGEISVGFFGANGEEMSEKADEKELFHNGYTLNYITVEHNPFFNTRATLIPKAMLTYWNIVIMEIARHWAPDFDRAKKKAKRGHNALPEKRFHKEKLFVSICATFPRTPFDMNLQGKYGVHKHVLMKSSPVLNAMFRSQMNETQTKNVEIKYKNGEKVGDNELEMFITQIYQESFSFSKETTKCNIATIYRLAENADSNDKPVLSTIEDVKDENYTLTKDTTTEHHCTLPVSPHFDITVALSMLEIFHQFQMQTAVNGIDLNLAGCLNFANLQKCYEVARLYKLPRLLYSCADLTFQLFERQKHKKASVEYHDQLFSALQCFPHQEEEKQQKKENKKEELEVEEAATNEGMQAEQEEEEEQEL